MNIVFCLGLPKSGTTFLSQILNSHPNISCSPEQQIDFFFKALPQLFEQYGKQIANTARIKGDSVIRPFENEDLKEMLSLIITKAAKRGAQQRDVLWHGLYDNSIIMYPDWYIKRFPNAKFIHIIRNPASIVLSSWHHNHRVQSNFSERARDIESWATEVSKQWSYFVGLWQSLSDNRNILFCQYENLIHSPISAYKEIFDFLGVDTQEGTINTIIKSTTFKKDDNNKFYRKAETEEWRVQLSEESIENIKKEASKHMKIFNYDLSR